ncbi:MAG: hypothetical protein M3O70_24895 [Actinomycetota bacterium]|nr:hypothetical protein [Actinomycetota bacterium]
MVEVQTWPSALRSRLRADEEPVLPAHSAAALFGDDLWDLSAAGLPARVNPSDARLNFRSIGDEHWRLLAKEYFWARLNEAVAGSNRLLPQSARAEFSVFTIFVNWVLDPASHPPGFDRRLSLLDHDRLDAFVQSLRGGRGRPLSAGTISIYLRLIERRHDYSPFLSHDYLPFHPWRHRPSGRVAGFTKQDENKTPRIPQEVLGPFLRWALFYVDVASADILAGRDELAALRARQASLLFSQDEVRDRLVSWIEALRRDGRGIPARKLSGQSDGPEGDANLVAIAAACGLRPETLHHRPELRALIGDTAAQLGLEPWSASRQPASHPSPLAWVTHTKSDVMRRLDDYVQRRRGQGRGIPSWSEWKSNIDGQVNMPLIAAQIGTAELQRLHHPEAFALMDKAASELGAEPGGMNTPISVDPATGLAWRDRFGPNTVMTEARHLRAACYVVCAYLSGMRDGEIMELRRGAHRFERSADGVINRHRVHSVVSKGRRVPEPATWVVTEHVARAIEVMERLDAGKLLFGALRGRVEAINRFRDHVNRLSDRNTAVAIPAVSGAPWRFDSRQFRRTLAWFIGSQPFGLWAGSVQFKHRSVRSAMDSIGPTVFEGYLGSTPSGFPSEVELAKQAAADLYVRNLVAAHASGALSAGGGARRVNAQLEELRAELGDAEAGPIPPRVVDDARRNAMLRSVSRNLFVGPLTDCFFDPDVALCLRNQDRSGAEAPIISHCQPERCRNSRIGQHHCETALASPGRRV